MVVDCIVRTGGTEGFESGLDLDSVWRWKRSRKRCSDPNAAAAIIKVAPSETENTERFIPNSKSGCLEQREGQSNGRKVVARCR